MPALSSRLTTDILCAQCDRLVDKVQIELGVYDVRAGSAGTRVRAFCHGDMDVMLITSKRWREMGGEMPPRGVAFRNGKSDFFEDQGI